jgi:hypothetical protein
MVSLILLALAMGPTTQHSEPGPLVVQLMKMWETGDTSLLEASLLRTWSTMTCPMASSSWGPTVLLATSATFTRGLQTSRSRCYA